MRKKLNTLIDKCEEFEESEQITEKVADDFAEFQVNYMNEHGGAILPSDSASSMITNERYDQIIKSNPTKVFRIYMIFLVIIALVSTSSHSEQRS